MKNAVAKTLLMHNNAKYWIDQLSLIPHPEGGHFKEVYRSDEKISRKHLPERFNCDRSFASSIYFLLQKGELSAFHKIKSDETWYFHEGEALEIVIIDEMGILTRKLLGLNLSSGAMPQITVDKNQWFAAKTLGEFTLVSCNVAPGFDFNDFELGDFDEMVSEFPQYEKIFREFCIFRY